MRNPFRYRYWAAFDSFDARALAETCAPSF
jgi:hypothetical protein